MKEYVLSALKFLVQIDISKGISRRLYPKLLASLKTFPKSTYQKTSRGIHASCFGNFWWVNSGDQKYGWERTLRSIIKNFDYVDNTDVCDCKTFLTRAAKLTRTNVPYWVRCFFYEYNARAHKWEIIPLPQRYESIPSAIVISIDDVIVLLVEKMISLESGERFFKITNYCFIKGTPTLGSSFLEALINDKELRKS